MYRVNRFFITISQILLLNSSTKQSKIKLTITAFKAIGKNIKTPMIKKIYNAIKNSMGMFCQKKNTIKNVAFGLEKQGGKYLRTSHNIGSRPIKYLREAGYTQKHKVPQVVREGKQFITETKQLIQRSAEQMGGKELMSFANKIFRSKPQLPFLFVAGNIGQEPALNSIPTNFFGDMLPINDLSKYQQKPGKLASENYTFAFEEMSGW